MANGSLLGRLWPVLGGQREDRDVLRRGAMFRHVTPRGTVEIARVLGTTPDAFNIRHVHYALSFRYHEREVAAGERTLSASGFLERYSLLAEPAAAATPAVETAAPEPAIADGAIGDDDVRREPRLTIPARPGR